MTMMVTMVRVVAVGVNKTSNGNDSVNDSASG
jgi:hypothetical protein